MNLNNSTSFQEKQSESMSNEIALKITDTRNAIMNKFKMAYMNRLEREHELNQSMKPLTTPPLSATSNHANTKTESMQNDPNKICIRLKVLLNSKNMDNMQHTQEINSIISKLRELEIII